MRILPGLDTAESPPTASPDLERLDAVEKINVTLLQRIQRLEERLAALEAAPKAEALPIPPTVPTLGVTVDAEALKKGLLSKMWQHLNER